MCGNFADFLLYCPSRKATAPWLSSPQISQISKSFTQVITQFINSSRTWRTKCLTSSPAYAQQSLLHPIAFHFTLKIWNQVHFQLHFLQVGMWFLATFSFSQYTMDVLGGHFNWNLLIMPLHKQWQPKGSRNHAMTLMRNPRQGIGIYLLQVACGILA